MKQALLATTLTIGALLTVGCQPAIETETADPSPPESSFPESSAMNQAELSNSSGTAIANSQTSPAAEQPQLPAIATLTRIEQGDLQCYLSFTDSQGKSFDIGGSFDICTEQYLNQTVQITYELGSVNDCESIEPCGKSKEVTLVTQLKPQDSPTTASNSAAPTDSTTYRNTNWTVTVSNSESWSGINGTGNFRYRGCDSDGTCLDLTGGTATCRTGKCVTGWSNGNFSYALTSLITEDASDGRVQLVVREGNQVIVDETLQRL